MAITIKSNREIELMREAGRLLALVHEEMGQFIRPGVSTKEIDELGEKVIRSFGCEPNFLNYNGFPASVCVSVNDEVVHGIPNKNRILQEGDIVSLDAGLIYKGYHSDAAPQKHSTMSLQVWRRLLRQLPPALSTSCRQAARKSVQSMQKRDSPLLPRTWIRS